MISPLMDLNHPLKLIQLLHSTVSPTLVSGEQPLFTIILAIDTNEEPTQLLSKMSFTVTIIVIVIVIVLLLLLLLIIIMRLMISPYL